MLYAVFAQLYEDGVHVSEVIIHVSADSVQKLCPTMRTRQRIGP